MAWFYDAHATASPAKKEKKSAYSEEDDILNKWLITGANGNLGQRLIRTLLENQVDLPQVVAVVRSQRAAGQLEALAAEAAGRLEIQVIDYTDVQALAAAAQGCDAAVHLVGILKEAQGASYVTAHEESCTALAEALASSHVQHVCYLSIVGSTPQAANPCLASKGRAEQILRQMSIPTTILRVPMVLGEGDYASFALRKRATAGTSFTFRAASMEQPIYAGDVIRAVLAAASLRLDAEVNLGGPEVLSRRALATRGATALGNTTRVISLPYALGHGIAWLLERFSANPPITTAMLGVLDHDDEVEVQAALTALQMDELTSLDETLQLVLATD